MNKKSLLNSNSETYEAVKTIDQSLSWEKLIADSLSLGILAVAVIALAFSPIFTKLSEIEISPTATIFNRLWIATIIMSCWQLIKTPPEFTRIQLKEYTPDYKELSLLIFASIAATSSAVFWAISFTHTSVASSTVLRSLTPIFISCGAWLILKQRFNLQFILGMAISIIGGTALGWDDWQLGADHLVGDGIALLSAALHGTNILIVGYLRDHGCTTGKVLFWRCGFGALIILPLVWFKDTTILPISLDGWLAVLALAVICQTFGQGLLVFSLKQFSSSFVGIFTLLKPIITAVLAWVIFAENLSLASGLALILILVGIYLAKSRDSPEVSSVEK